MLKKIRSFPYFLCIIYISVTVLADSFLSGMFYRAFWKGEIFTSSVDLVAIFFLLGILFFNILAGFCVIIMPYKIYYDFQYIKNKKWRKNRNKSRVLKVRRPLSWKSYFGFILMILVFLFYGYTFLFLFSRLTLIGGIIDIIFFIFLIALIYRRFLT